MLIYFTTGTLFGLSAGLSPGPLATLVISETLQHNVRAGIKVACAPLITDLPIVILSIFIVNNLSNFNGVLGIISLLGGAFVFYLGIKTCRIKSFRVDKSDAKPKSLLKGIVVNILSPHPYLFWFSIGAPTLIKAANQNLFSAFMFVVPFYILLVGSKIMIVLLAGKSKSFLTGKSYSAIMKILGLLLVVFSCFLFHEGAKLLSWI